MGLFVTLKSYNVNKYLYERSVHIRQRIINVISYRYIRKELAAALTAFLTAD